MKRNNQKPVLTKIGFRLMILICLLVATILMINGLLAGNYLGELQNWFISILRAYRGPYLSFVFFGTAVVILIVMVVGIIDARRQAVCQAEEEKARALEEEGHANEKEKLNQELSSTNKQLEKNYTELKEQREQIENQKNEEKKQKDEISKLNEKLTATNQELEKNNKLLAELDTLRLSIIGAMEHDLNHVLSTLLGGVDSLMTFLEQESLTFQDDYVEKETKQIIPDMKQALLHLQGVSKDAFDQAKRQSGETIKLNKQELNLKNLVEAALRWNHSKLRDKKMDTEIQIPNGLMINVDKVSLTRIFNNLITNTIKYSPHNKKIIITAVQENNHILCQIIDKGIGIPSEYLEKIFDMYVKVDSDLANKTAGDGERHGIGLYPCKKIIEAHGGKIWAESEGENKGSTFSFTLPI